MQDKYISKVCKCDNPFKPTHKTYHYKNLRACLGWEERIKNKIKLDENMLILG